MEENGAKTENMSGMDNIWRIKCLDYTRKLFFIWEFLTGEGLQEDAREYLKEHEFSEMPFDLALLR